MQPTLTEKWKKNEKTTKGEREQTSTLLATDYSLGKKQGAERIKCDVVTGVYTALDKETECGEHAALQNKRSKEKKGILAAALDRMKKWMLAESCDV